MKIYKISINDRYIRREIENKEDYYYLSKKQCFNKLRDYLIECHIYYIPEDSDNNSEDLQNDSETNSDSDYIDDSEMISEMIRYKEIKCMNDESLENLYKETFLKSDENYHWYSIEEIIINDNDTFEINILSSYDNRRD